MLSYSSGDVTERRTLALAGGPVSQANGSPQESDFQASAMGGRSFRLAPETRLTATASFTVSDAEQQAFTERGADPFSLHVSSIKLVDYTAEAGVKLDRTFRLTNGAVLNPYVGVSGVLFEGDRTANGQLNFVGAPATPFAIRGTSLPGAWADIRVGVSYSPTSRWKLGVRYQGAFGDRLSDDSALGYASLSW